MIENAAYVWSPVPETGKDSYWNFRKTFLWNGVGSAKLQIAADSTYCVWINGVRCPIAQVADMPGDWTYSVYDVTINGVATKEAIVHTKHGDVLPSSADLAPSSVHVPALR